MSLLKSIFDKHLSKEKPKTPHSEFRIRPSVLGNKCLRQIFYSATGVSEDVPFPLIAKRRMILGTAIGEMLTNIFVDEKVLVKYQNPDGSTIIKDGKPDYEFPITSPELYIKNGKIDGVLIIEGKLWLGEYKSINQRGFDSLMGPKSDHLIQGVSYLYVFNQLLAEGKYSHIPELKGFQKAEGIRFLYVNKDDTDTKEFVVTNSDQTFEGIVKKIVTIKWHADNNVLPPCTPDYGRTCNCNWKIKSKNNQIR